MRGLINLIMALCLLVGLVGGSIAHASDLGGNGEVSEALNWVHVAGDGDEVPADADKNYPHHHNVCGHDVAAPVKHSAMPLAPRATESLRPDATAPLARASSTSLLRPPIA